MRAIIACCLVVLAAMSFAWAGSGPMPSVTIDAAMRGNAFVADPDVSGAWIYNPAALASLAGLQSSDSAGQWKHTASATFEVKGDSDLFAVNWGGVKAGKDFGLGAGYAKAWDAKAYGVGLGKAWADKGISWGVSWQHIDADDYAVVPGDADSDSQNLFDLGMLGRLPSIDLGGISNVRYGVVLRDLTAQFERTWDLGVAFDTPLGIAVAIDMADLTNEVDRRFRFGGTMRLGMTKAWQVGLGFDEGDPTAGFVYDGGTLWQGGSWRFGAAWQSVDRGDDSILLGAYAKWGL